MFDKIKTQYFMLDKIKTHILCSLKTKHTYFMLDKIKTHVLYFR